VSDAPHVRVVLVGGHESHAGIDIARFAALIDGARAVTAGRGLETAVQNALDSGERVVVVPMTFGLDPGMVADAAKTLRWLARGRAGDVALAAPFGTPDHLTSWLRTAANRAARTGDAPALLVVAPHSNAFDEAELHRVAYLVGTNGAHIEVAVAIADDPDDVTAAAARLRLLGVDHVVAVPSGFAPAVTAPGVESAGPLMSDASVLRVIRTRQRDALVLADAGDNGIAAGLMADHGHGYAHSHAFEGEGHSHTHAHPHDHADGTRHTHTHSGLHAHGDDAGLHSHALLGHDH